MRTVSMYRVPEPRDKRKPSWCVITGDGRELISVVSIALDQPRLYSPEPFVATLWFEGGRYERVQVTFVGRLPEAPPIAIER